jgi:hypothetical protein
VPADAGRLDQAPRLQPPAHPRAGLLSAGQQAAAAMTRNGPRTWAARPGIALRARRGESRAVRPLSLLRSSRCRCAPRCVAAISLRAAYLRRRRASTRSIRGARSSCLRCHFPVMERADSSQSLGDKSA